ncbi:uncharacterized protein LOC116246056 isoform X2 [Nymphaea colorata]|uniref:uncharacterized protein LOC116246056 isoform X2 n=1 Tax=Nymphaea colorata TaxID=210225 RepID=UPI00129D9BE7|nr:uncharacterized protein LOC116246056 isoform X2 [Nymphaea colorata]
MELKGNFVHQLQILPRSFRVPKMFPGRTRVFCTIRVSPFRDVLTVSSSRWKRVEALNNDGFQSLQQSSIGSGDISKLPDLSFDRLQISDQECHKGPKRVFGRYVARGAVLDEEYWTAAWLRAESHLEHVAYTRYADVYKRNFAEQAKKEEKNVRRTLLNSIVGTLDVCIRSFSHGESFPGDLRRAATFTAVGASCMRRYAYVANLCVAKYARRQGIGKNMMYLAIDFAMLAGIKKIFIHVNGTNKPAQELYQKIGFEMVEEASSPMAMDERLLMCLNL